ncbi:hypothetical protein D3C71_1451830 [compost metagenome]
MNCHGDGVVEGDDSADHAIGLAQGQVQLVRSPRDGVALQLEAQSGVVAQPLDAVRQVRFHGGDGVTAVGHLEHQQLVGVSGEGVGQPVQVVRALLHRQLRP